MSETGTAGARKGWQTLYRIDLQGGIQMPAVRMIYWEQDGAWLGYIEEYPDYWTQGESLDDLKEHLRVLYLDLTSGELPSIRRAEELIVS
jgi:hypothetical protein